MDKTALLTSVCLLSVACTTLRPVEAPREEIQRQILSAGLLKPGDEVRLVTTDGTRHDFRVVRVDVDAGVVSGADQTVRVAEIDTLEKRKGSALKTALLAAGLYFGFLFALAGAP